MQAVALQRALPDDKPLHMAVNLSARQLQRPEIVGEVAEILLDTGLDPGDLVLEITESVMMQDMELSIQRLARAEGARRAARGRRLRHRLLVASTTSAASRSTS